jgi:hypothetical protein
MNSELQVCTVTEDLVYICFQQGKRKYGNFFRYLYTRPRKALNPILLPQLSMWKNVKINSRM